MHNWTAAFCVCTEQESVTIEVSFLPDEAREYKTTVPLFLNCAPDSGEKPYLNFDVVATSLFPQVCSACLSFAAIRLSCGDVHALACIRDPSLKGHLNSRIFTQLHTHVLASAMI